MILSPDEPRLLSVLVDKTKLDSEKKKKGYNYSTRQEWSVLIKGAQSEIASI